MLKPRFYGTEQTWAREPKGRADVGVEVDLTYLHILRWLRDSVMGSKLNYVNA